MISYDTLIIGGGPAGMSAALFAQGDGLNFRLSEKGIPCQFVEETINTNFTNLENYLGLYDMDGTSVARIFRKHLEDRKIPLFHEEIKDIKPLDNLFCINSDKGEYMAKTIILATGTRPRELTIPGIENVLERVHYGINKDFSHYKNHVALVVGGRNSGAVTAVRLKEIGVNPIVIEKSSKSTAKTKYLEKLDELSIPLLTNANLEKIVGFRGIQEAHVTINNKLKIFNPIAIFGCIGYTPNNRIAVDLGLQLDKEGYIEVDRKMQTSMEGVYAAGDVNGGVKMIAVASGEGAIAEFYANGYLKFKWKE